MAMVRASGERANCSASELISARHPILVFLRCSEQHMNFSERHRRSGDFYHGLASFTVTSLILLAWPAQARAQTAEPDHVVLGVGAAVTPVFQGADDYRTLPLPVIDIKNGWLFANLRNGVGLVPINKDNVTIGMSAVFIQGYRRRDVRPGLDRLSSGIGARLFANIRLGGLATTVGATKGVSGGTEGTIADLAVSYPLSVSSKFSLTPTVGTTWADAKHNDRYFGVTAAESAATGLLRFATGSGFKDASASLTASYRLTNRITLSATGTFTTLLGSLKHSPQVEERTQPASFFTVSYRL
jgi:outer membrane protein